VLTSANITGEGERQSVRTDPKLNAYDPKDFSMGILVIFGKEVWSGEQDLNLRRLGVCGLCRLE
jgi:hypothetical protein